MRHTIKQEGSILLRTKNRMAQNVRKFQTLVSRNILSNLNKEREQRLMLNANKKKILKRK
jgi:hypothetical protein